MGTKVKGLLKGLKHLSITNMFEDKEQEEEIQIGFPTDVKHVAHIGMDDANNTTKPSWMGDYKAAPELAPQSGPALDASSRSSGGEKSKHRRRDKDKNKDKEGSSHHRSRRSRDTNNLSESEDGSVAPKTSRKKKTKGSSSSSIGEGSTSKSSRKGQPPTREEPAG